MNRPVLLFLSLTVQVVSVAACIVPTPTVMPTERPSLGNPSDFIQCCALTQAHTRIWEEKQ
jgi:hypothetical protein